MGEFDVQWDDAFGLGLAYMHARHYSPTLGRFLQPDPDGSEANLYAYTANNPVTEMDPDGTCFIILCIAVGVVLFGGLGAAFGTANYATTTPRDDWRADDAAGAAAGAFVEAGSYAIPGAGAGVPASRSCPRCPGRRGCCGRSRRLLQEAGRGVSVASAGVGSRLDCAISLSILGHRVMCVAGYARR